MSEPMLTLNGVVTSSFVTPTGVNQEGKEYGGDTRVQIMCDMPLKNGELKKELVTLKARQTYEEGQVVSIPVGIYVKANQPHFFAL